MSKSFYSLAGLSVIFLFAVFSYADDAPADKPVELRVLSYNIHVGIGTDKKLDLERTARVIKELEPDLVALQEVDRVTRRTEKVDQAYELEKLTGLNAVFGKTIAHGGGEYGIAVLSRFPILEHKITQLPGQERLEDRGVLETLIRIGEKTEIRFACTHFCHVNEERRIRQAEKINELFAGDELPTIVAGDFNAAPERKSIATLLGNWTDATDRTPTFGDPPFVKIDYIFYRPARNFRVKETRVIDDRVTSDHCPVLSVLEYVPAP